MSNKKNKVCGLCGVPFGTKHKKIVGKFSFVVEKPTIIKISFWQKIIRFLRKMVNKRNEN